MQLGTSFAKWGLGLFLFGVFLTFGASQRGHAPESSWALALCVIGLLGVFAVGYPGYFVFDAIWPGYYYSPVPAGKNAWLLGQAFFIAVYFAGALVMFNAVRRALNAIPAAA